MAEVSDEPLTNGVENDILNNKDIDITENVLCSPQDEISGSDRDSDSPTPSLFRKFYEAKTKGIYDSRNQDVIAFIVDTMTSDSKKEDRTALMDAHTFLVDSGILDQISSVTSVNWNCAEANGRRVMHKLCEFFGLNHNIRGAAEPNSMTIERKQEKFRAWEFTLTDLAAHLQEKQNQQTKTILKRSVDSKTSSKAPGGPKENQTNSIASYDERQRNYIAVKQKLGISSDEPPFVNTSYMSGRAPIVRRNNRQSSPDDVMNYRKMGIKNLPNVPPLMGPVYDPPLMTSRAFPQYIVNTPVPMPVNQHCIVMRRCSVDQLSPADIHNAYVTRDGRWHEMVSFNGAESVFSPCDDYVSMFLNRKHLSAEFGATPYPSLSSGDLHGSDGSESFNGSSKVLPSPMLPTGMAAQMISSVNGSFPPYVPQTFSQTPSGLPVNGQPHLPIGGAFIGNPPFYHSSANPSQQPPQHPPPSLTPQEHHMRSSLSMSQMNQHAASVPPSGEPGAPSITNGPLVYTPSAQQMALSDIANRVSTPPGPSTAQAPQGVLVGIPSGQPQHNPCTGAPPPPVTAQWPVGVNGPPPVFTPAHSQYVTQAGPAVGPILRPATVPAGNSAANNFFAPVSHKMQPPGVITQAAGPQTVGFPAVHPGAAHLQSAPHRAYLGQPLMQVSVANSHHGPSNFQRNGRRGPLSRQNSHNGANGHQGGNSVSNSSGVPVSGVH